MKLAWATDIHLDFLNDEARVIQFAESVKALGADGLVLTGDISVADQLVLHLSMLERVIQLPINFVLGNHDYYGGSIDVVRKQMKEVSNMSGFLKYLPTTPYVVLSPSTALVGHDGWYDALHGNYRTSSFVMSDWMRIWDFVETGAAKSLQVGNHAAAVGAVVPKARELAHVGVQHVHDGIKAAVRYHTNVIVATHFPPFEESHQFQGQRGGPDAMPWYTSKMMGDVLRQAATAFPAVQFTVLSGHTHGEFRKRIMPNLMCHVGAATYGQPSIADVLLIS